MSPHSIAQWVKRRVGAIVIAGTLLYFAIVLVYALLAFRTPYLGLRAEDREGRWVVTQVVSDGLGRREGLKPGDVIRSIEGRPPSEWPSLRRTERIERAAAVEVWEPRSGQLRTVLFKGPNTRENLAGDISAILGGQIAMVLGSIFFYQGARSRGSLHFYAMVATEALAVGVSPASSRGLPGARELVFTNLALFSSLLVHFVLDFPEPWPRFPRQRTWVLYLPALTVLTVYTLHKLSARDAIPLYRLTRSLLIASGSVGVLVTIGVLVARSWGGDSPRVVSRLRIALVLLVLALVPFVFFYIIPQELTGREWVSSYVTIQALALTPVSMGYLLFRYDFLAGGHVFRRFLPYGIIAIAGLGAYPVFFLLADPKTEAGFTLFAAVEAAVGGAVLAAAAKEPLERWVGRNLLKDYYDYQVTLREFSGDLGRCSDLEGLVDLLANRARQVLYLNGACLVLWDEDGGLEFKAASGEFAENESVREFALANAEAAKAGGESEPRLLSREFPVSAVVPIVSEGKFLGVLYLGRRRNGAGLTDEDHRWLSTMANQASTALVNARLFARLSERLEDLSRAILQSREDSVEFQRFGHLLLDIQKQERRRLARDLHDGIMQGIVGLIRGAERCLDLLGAGEGEARIEVQKLIEQAEDVNYELRELCFHVYPPILEDLGLVPSLRWLVQKVMRQEDFIIDLQVSDIAESRRLSQDAEWALFRTVQEALNNVAKHAKASRVNVSLALADQWVTAGVTDDGRGFDPQTQLAELLKDGHIGLWGIRETVQRIGGVFEINSEVEQGTKVFAAVPARFKQRGKEQGGEKGSDHVQAEASKDLSGR